MAKDSLSSPLASEPFSHAPALPLCSGRQTRLSRDLRLPDRIPAPVGAGLASPRLLGACTGCRGSLRLRMLWEDAGPKEPVYQPAAHWTPPAPAHWETCSCCISDN